ncbi:MAG: ECF-type sigma factor [Planctomycetota bacterium]
MQRDSEVLMALERGEPVDPAELLPLVYRELRQLAARELATDGARHSLQPTVVVHEAYLKLFSKETPQTWSSRRHFFGAAAIAMRRILVDHARKKRSLKRGGDRRRVELEVASFEAPEESPDLLDLDSALTDLASEHPRLSELVSLRYFAGLKIEQAAATLHISRRTAERDWTYAKAWLLERLHRSD